MRENPAPESARSVTSAVAVRAGTPHTEAFSFSGSDREALSRELSHIADLAFCLSNAELHDLACHTGRKTSHGPVRAGVVASSPDQLSLRAREAITLLDGLPRERLTAAPGVFAADSGAGRVVLLFPGEVSPLTTPAGRRGALGAGTYDPSLQPTIVAASLAGLRWLGQLGVDAAAGVGHGVGEITGLVWAGCLSEPDAARLVAQRGTLLALPAAHRTSLVCVGTDSETAQRLCTGTGLVIAAYNGPRCHVLAGPETAVGELRQRLSERGIPARRLDSPHGFYSPAMSDRVAPLRSILRELTFRPPSRRLISTVTGAELAATDDIMLLLCKQLMSAVRFAGALDRARAGADLLVETGPGHVLSRLATDCCDVPAVTLAGGRADDDATALVAAALFAAGAVSTLAPLVGGRHAAAGPPGRAIPGRAAPAQSTTLAATPTAAAGVARRDGTPAVRPDPDHALTGVGPWVRCFTQEPRAAQPPEHPAAGKRWRLRAAPSEPLSKIARRVFRDDPNAGTVLAVLGGLTEPGAGATMLDAAREAIGTGRLVVVSAENSVTGFCASLQAEHPALGVTAIKTAPGQEGLEAAKRFAAATPGVFREVLLDETGRAVEPAMVPTVPGAEGTFPLGPADVVLISGMTRPGDLACATALASRGAALAVLAPPGPGDPRLAAYLAELRAAGARVSRKRANLTDPAQVAAAVRSLERGLGPVTAVVHAAAPGPAGRCARLSEPVLRGCLASEERRFSAVLAAVALERLRVLVTFGSITARYGAPGGACDGLASGLLAEQARRQAAGLPRCRALHIDWAPWAEPDTRGTDPGAAMRVSVPDAARLLISMLTTPDLPHRVAVHGRLRESGAAAVLAGTAGPPLRGRFLDTVRVHYPDVELVVDARLSLQADPYLADYRIDSLPVLPAPMALEAMAQSASALAGTPQRHAASVRMAFPVAVPTGESVIRVCALRSGDTVETVLRCAETGFRVDHARAVFRAARAGRQPRWLDDDCVPTSGIVDGTDLYGPVHFQAGRFRRVAFLTEVSSRGCRALVRGIDDKPWFGALPGPMDVPLILGSPGLNDAALQVLQTCLPHRRLLVASCESVTFSGHEARGAVEVHAVRLPSAGSGTTNRAGGIWDVSATDAAGQLVVAWTGVTLRDLGPVVRADGWQPTLLAASLEARAGELGIDPSLRATISCGLRPGAARRRPAELALPQPRSAETAPAGPPPHPGHWSDTAVGRGPLDGFELTVRAARPVACRWHAVGSRRRDIPRDDELGRLRNQLTGCLAEPEAAVEARMTTIASCLAALGREPGTPCALEDACDGGWIVVRSSGVVAGCAITGISNVSAPVAVSIASRGARAAAERALPPGRPAQEKGVSA